MSTDLYPVKAIIVNQEGQTLGRFIALDFRGGIALTDEGNVLGVEVEDVPAAEVSDGLLVADIPISAGTFNQPSNTIKRSGAQVIDLSRYPATLGGLTREIKFKVVLENALDSAAYYAEALLYDVTNSVVITGSTLNNSGASNRGIANEYTSSALAVGTTAGTIRSNTPTLYAAEFYGVGITNATTEAAIISSARLQVRYV